MNPTDTAEQSTAKKGRQRPPLSPTEQLARQDQRSRVLAFILSVFLLTQVIMFLGGAGLWYIVSSPVTKSMPAEDLALAQRMLPTFRLGTLYTVLLMIATYYTRKAAIEKWPHAFTLNVVLIVLLFLAFPFGTLAAPFMLLFMLPRKWLDLRPRRPKSPEAPA